MEKTLRPIQVPHLRKLGLFSIVLTLLYVAFFGIVMNPNIPVRDGQAIFAVLLGATIFTSILMLSRETKQWRKQQTLGQ